MLVRSLWVLGSLLSGLTHHVLAQAKPSDESIAAEIRALRAQSNRAIAAHDVAAFGQTMLVDVEVTRGSGVHVSGRDSVLASLAAQFTDKAFLEYVREPDSIQVSRVNPLVAEHGHWTGRWRRPDGIQTVRGTYLAMWRRTDAGWKIRSELFVTLSCAGSAACDKMN